MELRFPYILLNSNHMNPTSLFLLVLLVSLSGALEIGECLQRHSDGWSCLRCRENYHLFEGRCFIDILGCSEYHDGNICRQCDSHYMLVNNLCCDAVCLQKILAAPVPRQPAPAGDLSEVLAAVERGPLAGSLFRLVSVQSHKFIDVVRYYLMYHITASFTKEYIVKRAVVDYALRERQARLVDWRQPASEGDFAKIGRNAVDNVLAVVAGFKELYPTLDAAEKYRVEVDDLAEVKEYRVLHYDERAGEANLKVFYRAGETLTLLADETDPIDLFRPYRLIYSCEDLKKAVPENAVLEGAVTLALNTPELSGSDISQVTEWANDAKLVTFRVAMGNSSHSGELILHFLPASATFTVVSITVHAKLPAAPTPVKLPTLTDSSTDSNGEREEVLTNIEHNDHAQTLIHSVQTYLAHFATTVTEAKQEEFRLVTWVVRTTPVRISLLSNCKYTEIAMSYLVEGGAVFVYFIQENKSKELTYVGTKNGTAVNVDPSVGQPSALELYSPEEFQANFGFKPTFARKAVRQISTRQTPVFRRTTLSVASSSSTLDHYYMYTKQVATPTTASAPSKLFSCVCKGPLATHHSSTWSDSLGQQTTRSDDIQSITARDEVAAQALVFLHASHPQSARWTVVEIELTEYELKLEYVFSLREEGGEGRYLLAVVLHDKKDHSNALVAADEASEEQWSNFQHAEGEYELIAADRLPLETDTDAKVTAVLDKLGKEVQQPKLEGVLRSHETPTSEKNLLLLRDVHETYWVAIAISSQGEPILEEVRVVEQKVAVLLLEGIREDVYLTTEVESVSSGVIFEGEAFQIQSNISEERMSEEMKLLVGFVEKEAGKIEGVLVNVEQHSDGVATEFALSFKTATGNYNRYFIVRSQESPNPLYYLGQEATPLDPQTHLFFAPTPPLSPHSHHPTFLNFIRKVNVHSGKHYDLPNILNLWTRTYPRGDYTVGYASDSVGQSACYVLNLKEESYVLKWIETKGQNVQIESVVPVLTVGLEKGSESVDLGVVVTQVVEVKKDATLTTGETTETTTTTTPTTTTTSETTPTTTTTTSETTTSPTTTTTTAEESTTKTEATSTGQTSPVETNPAETTPAHTTGSSTETTTTSGETTTTVPTQTTSSETTPNPTTTETPTTVATETTTNTTPAPADEGTTTVAEPNPAETTPTTETTSSQTAVEGAETTTISTHETTTPVETTETTTPVETTTTQTTTTPVETGTPVEKTITTTEATTPETTTTPVETTSTKTETTTSSGETTTGAATTGETTPTTETTTTPAAETTTTPTGETTPVGETTTVTETTTPTGETTTTGETTPVSETTHVSETTTGGETTTPVGETTHVVEEATTPAGETTHVGETTTPVGEATHVGEETTTHAGETTTTTGETTTPVGETTTHVAGETTTTTAGETTHVTGETTTTVGETTHIAGETTTPVGETTTPSAEATTTSGETTTHVAGETTTTPVGETTTTATSSETTTPTPKPETAPVSTEPTTPTTPAAEPTTPTTSSPTTTTNVETTVEEKEDQPTVVITTSEPETVITQDTTTVSPGKIVNDAKTEQETTLEGKTEGTTTIVPTTDGKVETTTVIGTTEPTKTETTTTSTETATTEVAPTTTTETTTHPTETTPVPVPETTTVTTSTTPTETTPAETTPTVTPVPEPTEPTPVDTTHTEPTTPSEPVHTETTTEGETTTGDTSAETATTVVHTGVEGETTQTGSVETTTTETGATTTSEVATTHETTPTPTPTTTTTTQTTEPTKTTESTTTTTETTTKSETVPATTPTTTETTTTTTPTASETTPVSPTVPTTPEPLLISSCPVNFLTVAIEYLKTQFIFSTCTLEAYTETKYTSGADETVTLTCPRGESPMKANVSLSINGELKVTENYIKWYQPLISSPSTLISEPTPAPFTPPVIQPLPEPTPAPTPTETITIISSSLVTRVQNIVLEQIDPNELYEIQALQLITTEQKKDPSLVAVANPSGSTVIEQIVVYLRASYVLLDNSAVIRVSQDVTRSGDTLRYVLYFFLAPLPGEHYQVYRAVVDYDTTTSETRIFILAFDSYVRDNAVVAVGEAAVATKTLDVDVAYGYEKMELAAAEADRSVQTVVKQIRGKYGELTKGKSLETVEWLELKSGKSNYRITFLDPLSHQSSKFVVFFDPTLQKTLILNSITPPSPSSELSESDRASDPHLQPILQLLSDLHHPEMQNYKLQCVSRGISEQFSEYHVSWSSEGRQFRSTVRVQTGALRETAFAEVETISLDHYRLDEFEKLFIMNYQKLTDEELKNDGNFLLVLQALRNGNATLARSTLVGAAQKPLGLGYLFHLFFRLENGSLDRAEVYLELYSLKVTLRNIKPQDFSSGLVELSQSDAAVRRILTIIAKQAAKPPLSEDHTVTSVQAKDFLFGRLFTVLIKQAESSLKAVLYHDQSTEAVQLFSWTEVGVVANCLQPQGEKCAQCVEGYSLLNGVCVFGCGTLCRQETH